MLGVVLNYLPKPLQYQIGALAIANKYVVLPAAKSTATFVTTKFGLMNKEEAKIQEDLFDDYAKPYTKIFDTIENELWDVLTASLEPLGYLLGLDKENDKDNKKQIETTIEDVSKGKDETAYLSPAEVYKYESKGITKEEDLIPYMKTKKPIDVDLYEALQTREAYDVGH